MGPHCSFCESTTGPFREVEGLFTVLMCANCQAVRSCDLAEVLAYRDPGQPWLEWGCPLEGCGLWVVLPWDLEVHAAAEHPGWIARYELVRPYPYQQLRVVFRRVESPPTT